MSRLPSLVSSLPSRYPLVFEFLLGAGVLAFVLLAVILLVWLERKIAGDIQSRVGPNRVGGRFGILQTVADGIKLLLKEDIIPAKADRWLFITAPFLVFIPPYLAYVVLPFGKGWVVRDLPIGVLFAVAVSSLPTLGLIMAGWGSNNKWSLLGGLRGAAQLVSYEVPMVLAVVAAVMMAGSLSTVRIVENISSLWATAFPPILLSFLIYLTSAIAEVNRVPFDIPEAESELVAGYHVEYSGMRFAFFFLAEYAAVFFVCGLGVTLFLGGWKGPGWFGPLSGPIWFLVKTGALVYFMMWVRWTLPRLRVDQLMNFAWKLLIPLALFNLVFTGFWTLYLAKG